MAETWAKVAAMPPKLPPRLPKVASIPAWHCHLQREAQCRRQGWGARRRFLLLRQVLAPSRWLLPQQRHQQIKRSSAGRSRHQRQLHAYSKTARSQPSAADSAAATGSQRSRATHQAAQVNFNFRFFAFFSVILAFWLVKHI